MRSLTASGGRPASPAHDASSGNGSGTAFDPGPGRWIWGLTGLIAVIGLAVPGTRLIVNAGDPGNYSNGQALQATTTKTVTITQPVTSLSVESYGAPIQVTARPVHRVMVTETISYGKGADSAPKGGRGPLPDSDPKGGRGPLPDRAPKGGSDPLPGSDPKGGSDPLPGSDPKGGGAPAVTAAVSDGRLTLAAPACATSGCSVGFTVTVPSGVAVTAESDNGPVTVSGTADTDLDSGGGPVSATNITGSLTVTSENGNITATGANGANIDSGGGAVIATRINGPLTVTSENGNITAAGAQGAMLNSGGGAVDVTSITGSLTVTSENGDVVMNDPAGQPGTGAVGGSRPTSTATLNRVVIMTGGGNARLAFATAPADVLVSTSNGSATLALPGGPYAVTANSGDGGGGDDGPAYVGVPTSGSAHRSITVDTQGGALSINRN
jgi:hypothetical protein